MSNYVLHKATLIHDSLYYDVLAKVEHQTKSRISNLTITLLV